MANQATSSNLFVSVYKDFKNKTGDFCLFNILEEIKSDKYKSEIDSIRYALHKEDKNLADTLKSKLLSFTTSGTFRDSRTKGNLASYTKVICLDFDDVPTMEIPNLSTIVNNCEYTLSSFISPSNKGLKVFIALNSEAEHHTTSYNEVAAFYQTLTGYDFDSKCKDVTRLCFVSYDPDLFINRKASIFKILETEVTLQTKTNHDFKAHLTSDELLDKCLQFTEQKEQYITGNRNNFIYLFASNANRFGIYENETLNYCLTNFDLSENEIKATVKSTYKNKIADFAKFAKFANMQNATTNNPSNEILSSQDSEEPEAEVQDFLKTTPTIPDFVYNNLPTVLKECCEVFKSAREKDVFLTSALAIISGCLPNVSGLYSGSEVFPSLFTFILAPAASGKGALKYAKNLADEYHKKVLDESKELKKQYEEKLEAYKFLKAKGKLEQNQSMPIAPKQKVVFIPANTSNAKIIQHLDWNNGSGIICETEADTLGQTFKNDWGAYSDLLRKSFHHEKISKSIKTDGEYVEVNKPQLSVALSGTPKQIFNIISSAEDGLFSRFMFYVFKTDAVWLDPSPKGNPVNLTDFFDKKSKWIYNMVLYYERDEMILHLTAEQWDKFNPIFEYYLHETNLFVSEDALSIVKRLGLILYRICMILTAIRKYENKEYHKDIYCADVDFNIAIALIEVYLKHNTIMFNNLPKQDEQTPFKSSNNKRAFFDNLPQSFQRKDVLDLAKKYNMSVRSLDNFLKSCVPNFLSQPKTGFYQKINQ